MNKILALASLALSLSALAAPVILNENSSIKASEINSNFGEVKTLLTQKNTPVLFHEFKSGDLIEKQIIEGEFDKVRTLGIEVSPLISAKVSAQELNLAFAQMVSGIAVYNDLPLVRGANVNTLEDTVYSGTFDFTNNVGVSTIQITSHPSKGSVVVLGSTYIYTPELNKFGSDKFSFQLFDGEHYSSVADVNLNINAVNDIPVSQNFSFTTLEDTAKPFTLTATDVESSSLNFIVVTPPEHGTLSGSLPSTSYTPTLDYSGNDSFSFKVSDGDKESQVYTVSFSVTSVNDAPVIASTSSLSVNQNSTNSGSVLVTDPDSSTFTYSIFSQGTKGTASISSSGVYSYATNNYDLTGVDSFIIEVSDGIAKSNKMTVGVNIAIDSSIIALAPNSSQNYNIFHATGGRTDKVTVFLNIRAGVDMYSNNTGLPALTTGSGWHAQTQIRIINNGRILGMGGAGAQGGVSSTQNMWFPAYQGQRGGDALEIYRSVVITNNGVIYGGGGGGGSAPSFHGRNIASCGGGGGGGQGYGGSAGGPLGSCVYQTGQTAGGWGNINGPGAGGRYGSSGGFVSGNGGHGGTWGNPGNTSDGSYTTYNPHIWGSAAGTAGGAAGNAIRVNGNGVTWISGNNGSQVKGPVN